MILKLIKLYIVEVTRLLSQKNHSICLCRFKVISIFVKFICNFLTLLRQSWPLMLGHLTLPTPLNQCCNQIWYAMKFARRVHSNTTLKGGEGRMELEYLKKKTELCTSVPTIFVQDCRLLACLLSLALIFSEAKPTGHKIKIGKQVFHVLCDIQLSWWLIAYDMVRFCWR